MNKKYSMNVVDTLKPGSIDKKVIEYIKKKQVLKNKKGKDYVELRNNIKEILNTRLYNLGLSCYIGLLRK